MNKTIIGIISILLLAVGAYFCIFLSPNGNVKQKDSYALPTSSTTTEAIETTTTAPVFTGQEYVVSSTEFNDDIYLSLDDANSSSVKLTTINPQSTSWVVTRTKNTVGEQCFLYSIDSDNSLIMTLAPNCEVIRSALITVTVNNRKFDIRVFKKTN